MSKMLRQSLDELGVLPGEMDAITERFLSAIEKEDADPLDAYVEVTRKLAPVIEQLINQSAQNSASAGATIDPNSPVYGDLESLPKSLRMTVITTSPSAVVERRLSGSGGRVM